MGIGVLYGKDALLEQCPLTEGAGDMIDQSKNFSGTTFTLFSAKIRGKHAPVCSAIGLWAALNFWPSMISMRYKSENALGISSARLSEIQVLNMWNRSERSAFVFHRRRAHPLTSFILDAEGITIRTDTIAAGRLWENLVMLLVGHLFAFYQYS